MECGAALTGGNIVTFQVFGRPVPRGDRLIHSTTRPLHYSTTLPSPRRAHRVELRGALERRLAGAAGAAGPAGLAAVLDARPGPVERGADLETEVDHLPRLQLQ